MHVIPINEEHEYEMNSELKKSIKNTLHQVLVLKKPTNIIPDEAPFRYNTRRHVKLTKGYTNGARELWNNMYANWSKLQPQYINHIYYPATDKICIYSQLPGGKVPGKD